MNGNAIGGYYDYQRLVIHTPEGPNAIADAIRVCASLKSMSLSRNHIGSTGAWHIAKGISVSKSLTSIDLTANFFGCEGAKYLADGISVNASLKSIDIGYNKIGQAMAIELIGIFNTKQLVSVGLGGCCLGVKGAEAVADYIAVSTSLTEVLAFG